ncbi:putative glucose-methanol-choline oxidoreductase, protein Hothead [Helianthus anomalus]
MRNFSFIRRASSFSSPSSSSNQGEKGYDYIVVGGGTAGCPLAATLSQKYNVLLLERGGVPFTNRNVSFLSNFHLTLVDTSNTSPSQYFVSNDGVYNARARVLGGGTSINAGFYTRASASVYMFIRVNYIISPCGLHKITYLGTNSLKSPSRVLTFHFVTFGGINF